MSNEVIFSGCFHTYHFQQLHFLSGFLRDRNLSSKSLWKYRREREKNKKERKKRGERERERASREDPIIFITQSQKELSVLLCTFGHRDQPWCDVRGNYTMM
jgi:hypothetical protein